MKYGLIGCGLLLTLCGCADQAQVVDISSIPAIQADLKRQIGLYIAEVSARETYLNAHPDDQAVYWCGNGSLDFMITSVKLDLTTSLDRSDTISGSASVPLVNGSVGPAVSGANDVANTQELIFTEYAFNPAAQPDEVRNQIVNDQDLATAPIAQSLLGLRNGLIAASRKSSGKGPQACFSDVPLETMLKDADPGKGGSPDSGNSFRLGVTVTRSGSEGLTLKLGPVNLGNTLSQKMTASNTITVAFKPFHPTAMLAETAPLRVAALDAADTVKAADPPKDPCKGEDKPASCYKDGKIHAMDKTAVPEVRPAKNPKAKKP